MAQGRPPRMIEVNLREQIEEFFSDS